VVVAVPAFAGALLGAGSREGAVASLAGAASLADAPSFTGAAASLAGAADIADAKTSASESRLATRRAA
jgi:hypothetical protein